MKRILIFSLAYYPRHVSGAEVAIKEITDRIAPSDIEFHMVTLRFDPHDPHTERVGNVEVHRVASGSYLGKMLFPLAAAREARRLHQKAPFDAAWAMMTYMTLPLVLARGLGVRIPYALTLQDGDPYEKVFGRLRIKPFLPLINRGFRGAAVIQAISKYLAEWPAKRGYRGTLEIIPNGASLESAARYPESELEALRTEVGRKAGEVLLLSVSRLVHQKAIDMVIRALPHLPPRVRYLIVGDGEDREALERLTKELGVSSRVIFTGRVDRTMTGKYRAIADIFVLPSRSEGQGISFLSTMVAGLPIVATQVGGIADFLFDEKRNPGVPPTGWAVDVDAPEQIAAAVNDILAHPEKAERAVENARRMAKERYDWNVIAEDMRRKVFARIVG